MRDLSEEFNNCKWDTRFVILNNLVMKVTVKDIAHEALRTGRLNQFQENLLYILFEGEPDPDDLKAADQLIHGLLDGYIQRVWRSPIDPISCLNFGTDQ